MTEEQISFLPELDATEPEKAWLFPDMESTENENGVYCNDVRQYKRVEWNKYQVELTIAAVGDRIYYEYGYTAGPDNYYGSYSPLDEDSYWCHRNNNMQRLKDSICNTFKFTKLCSDRNLSQKSRDELYKLMRKLVEEMN